MKQANGCRRGAFGRDKGEGAAGSQGEHGKGKRPVADPQVLSAIEPESGADPLGARTGGDEPGALPPRGETQPGETRIEQTLLDWLGHELRNPIAAIELAVGSMRDLGDARLESPLSILERQSRQLGHVMLQVIDMARTMAQTTPLARPGHDDSFGPLPASPTPFSDNDASISRRHREPRAAPASARRGKRARGTDPLRERHLLLLVEDNPDLSELLRDLLVSWGFEVIAAASATAALATAEKSPPDVALIDIGLPDRDGCEVARALRNMLPPDVPLFAMSGYGQREDGARALAAGFDEFLVKPLNTGRLRRLLGDVAGAPLADTARKA